ncbi:hypothetical protein NSU_pLA1021 (plasmid) [Novosphingobium pentaromativorans US6-1]|uniref:Uncharacterized protein n=1 Tax=Novosphingobium pentaromativorans US6-1 TaxID=1088721 RepID=G6EKU9_9SPHN|nr:hypothetical protein NSU_pLA1021 [Novosphingobium pentaromativorans US6-1]
MYLALSFVARDTSPGGAKWLRGHVRCPFSATVFEIVQA